MATAATDTSRPGLQVGPDERVQPVLPGQARATAEALRAALRDLQDTPGYRPGDYGMAIATIHEARFVLFDDDTRLAFITSFDGPWDAYMEDFFTSGPTLALFDVIFRHTEGYEGLPDRAALKAFILGAQQTAAAYARNYGGHGEGDPEGAARQRGLPAGAGPSGRRGGAAAPCAAAAAGRGRGLDRPSRGPRTPMSDHISGPRALADPIADITDVYAFPSPERPGHLVLVMNTLPFAQPSDALSDGLVYRFRLRPLAEGDAGRPGAVRRPAPRSSSSTASSPLRPATDGRACEQEGTCTTPAGEAVSFAVNDEQGGSGHGVRVFAGPRWDPFIMDARAALTTIATGQAGVHRPRLDLPRRQERPEPRRRGRLRDSSAARSWSASWRRRSPAAGSPCGSSAWGGRR